MVFDFSGADGSTDIGAILFRKQTTFKFIMSDVDDVMTIGGLARYTKGDGTITGNLVFENFRNNLIKIEDYEELRLTDEGICTFDTGSDVATVTITASNGGITSEGGKWSIVDGFLCNSNFGPAVPEPAEWAMIFGSIALGLAVYRKRK